MNTGSSNNSGTIRAAAMPGLPAEGSAPRAVCPASASATATASTSAAASATASAAPATPAAAGGAAADAPQPAAPTRFLDALLLQIEPAATAAAPAPAAGMPPAGDGAAADDTPASDTADDVPPLPPALLAPANPLLPQALAIALQQLQTTAPQGVQPQARPTQAGYPALLANLTGASRQDLTPPATGAAAVLADTADGRTAGGGNGGSDGGGAEATSFATQLAAATLPAAPADARPSAPPMPVLHLPPTSPREWQSPLLQALGDRIQLQIAARSEQATIRLEPPQLGRVDIEIRQLAGAAGPLQVRLEASHVEVVQQLQQISDGLRWNLSQQRQGGEVVVQVAGSAAAQADGRSGDPARQQQQQQQQQLSREQQDQRPGRALSEAGETVAAFALN